jgi:hypothetical protein
MGEKQIQHFLVIYDISEGHARVERFGTDYEAAVKAYDDAEREHRDDDDIEVVLLGSDSIETLGRTHSSYFELREKHVDQVIGRELAELGLR